METQIEHEICGNCKKEIPHFNYVMHTAHCARNINLCPKCKEPFPKNEIESHIKKCEVKPKKPAPPPLPVEKNGYYQKQKVIADMKTAQRREKRFEKLERLVDTGHSLQTTSRSATNDIVSTQNYRPEQLVDSGHSLTELPKSNSSKKVVDNSKLKTNSENQNNENTKNTGCRPKVKPNLIPCQYCELELPKSDLEEHENYCGARTDKCAECGEHVMFKYKQLHIESNHGFLKLNDEPGPRPSWESNYQQNSVERPRRRPPPLRSFADFEMPFLGANYSNRASMAATEVNGEKLETSKEISRRLDCPAPQPPGRKRNNPPTELVIPCEFCNTPIPHEDLIQHETGCRPDLARLHLKRRSPSPDEYFTAPVPRSPEVELPCQSGTIWRNRNMFVSETPVLLPCEFCNKPIPEDDLILHETGCQPPETSAVI